MYYAYEDTTNRIDYMATVMANLPMEEIQKYAYELSVMQIDITAVIELDSDKNERGGHSSPLRPCCQNSRNFPPHFFKGRGTYT